jgi:hypothetical protein
MRDSILAKVNQLGRAGVREIRFSEHMWLRAMQPVEPRGAPDPQSDTPESVTA